jgi:hypothetical protein
MHSNWVDAILPSSADELFGESVVLIMRRCWPLNLVKAAIFIRQSRRGIRCPSHPTDFWYYIPFVPRITLNIRESSLTGSLFVATTGPILVRLCLIPDVCLICWIPRTDMDRPS